MSAAGGIAVGAGRTSPHARRQEHRVTRVRLAARTRRVSHGVAQRHPRVNLLR